MTAADTLQAWGILRAEDVVSIARSAGLGLAEAATLLEQESGGGRNVWGSDGVATGGAYVKGAEVTASAYAAYRIALASGTAGAQGVGPCQLTWRGYQDQADRLGGCWSPLPNMRVGFATLAELQRQYGTRDGFRRYNGSGPAAERYADQTMTKLGRWQTRLGSASSTTPAAPAALTPEDDMLPDERAALIEVRDALRVAGFGKGRLPGRALDPARNAADDAFGWVLTAAGRADDAARGVVQLADRLKQQDAAAAPVVEIDYGKLAAALLAQATGKATL